MSGHFQNVGVRDDNALPNFQVFEFGLNFWFYDVNRFGITLRTFEGHLIFRQVDVGDFQLNLDLTVSFAARFVATWSRASFARAFGGAWQALADVGIEGNTTA